MLSHEGYSLGCEAPLSELVYYITIVFTITKSVDQQSDIKTFLVQNHTSKRNIRQGCIFSLDLLNIYSEVILREL